MSKVYPTAPLVAGSVPAPLVPTALALINAMRRNHQSAITPRPGNPTDAAQALTRAGLLVALEPGRYGLPDASRPFAGGAL